MQDAYRAGRPRLSPPPSYDNTGKPYYDADRYPDFTEWQARVREEADAMARIAATRPAVENKCAVEATRHQWIDIAIFGLKLAGLVVLYWALIWFVLIGRWIFRGFAG